MPPAEIAPAMIGRRGGDPHEVLGRELAVLILHIVQVLAADSRKGAVGDMQGPLDRVNEGIQVAIVECTVVDGAEGRLRSVLLESLLNALDHRHGLVPSAEFCSLHAAHGCGGKPYEQSKTDDGGAAHASPP